VGGQTVDKKDAVNPLTYLILKSVAQTKLPQPNLTVRYHKGLSGDFMKECIEVVRLGFGMPAFNSDEVIIPSFIEKGVDEKDAYNYSAIGCVEVAVPGKWGYRCTGMSFLNFPKSLLIALNNGVDIQSGTKLCEGIGHFKDMTSFDEVMKAWDKIIREFTRQSVIMDSCADLAIEELTADVLCSALTDDCIERGLNLKEGGAVYDFISDVQGGIANLGDSLAAIKKCVFEDKSITPAQLWDTLINNFEGEEGKKIQDILINDAPKYGNDDDYIDLLLKDAYDIYIDEMKKYKNTRYGRGPIGGCYYAGTSSISANVPQGAGTIATPDGRKAGEPLAEGCSPSHAMDKNGPTAVFKSVSKLPTHDITGGVLLNQKVTPQMLSKESDREKLISLIRTFFNRLEGFHVQYNVVSRDTLLDAQKHPEDYRDLIVRVAGYSAFFNVLSKQTQDDIIERTEQVL
jgi:formate C-acetyltransferase